MLNKTSNANIFYCYYYYLKHYYEKAGFNILLHS